MATATLSRLRASATAAHVVPLVVFMLFTAAVGWLRVENPELPWYIRAPEQWMYPLQVVAVAGLLLFFSPHFRLGPWRGLPLAVGLGVVGIAIWVMPAWLFQQCQEAGVSLPGWAAWFGVVAREKGFDPTVLAPWTGGLEFAVAMRFLRMVVIVPLVEEIFWRGFLMRYVAAGEGDWKTVPFGSSSWKVYGIVTLLVMVAHQPEDYLGAFVWGSLAYFVAVKTKSLGACVLMHAIGNLILGIYVMVTRQWGFW